METIKIVRINGEYQNKVDDSCYDYITPYTGFEHNHWFIFEEGKAIFDKLKFSCLTKQDKNFLPEYKMTKQELELEVVENFEIGDIPHIFLFSYEIPLYIWENKEEFAMDGGYEEDWMTYITDITDYSWKLEIDKVIEIPKRVFDKYRTL